MLTHLRNAIIKLVLLVGVGIVAYYIPFRGLRPETGAARFAFAAIVGLLVFLTFSRLVVFKKNRGSDFVLGLVTGIITAGGLFVAAAVTVLVQTNDFAGVRDYFSTTASTNLIISLIAPYTIGSLVGFITTWIWHKSPRRRGSRRTPE